MTNKVLVLRPEPGASETAARARAAGLEPLVAPLFEVRPLAWSAPEPAEFDAVLLTSANAARHGGLEAFAHLPCYAVGEATGAAAEAAGFSQVIAGPSDGAAALALIAQAGLRRVFRPAGRDHISLEHEGVSIERRAVYASDAVEELPGAARAALADGAVALIHSSRAGAVLGKLVDAAGLSRERISVAAISAAAGDGWPKAAVAARPRDEALLELAAKLCQTKRD